jgi:hypothetical protein
MSEKKRTMMEVLKAVPALPDSIDYDKVKAEWLKAIGTLHSMVSGWLKEALESGIAKTSATMVTLQEEPFGTYEAPQLTVSVGQKNILFVPKGRFVIGAKGRVDIVCGNKEVLLLLLGSNEEPSIRVRITTEGRSADVAKQTPPIPPTVCAHQNYE